MCCLCGKIPHRLCMLHFQSCALCFRCLAGSHRCNFGVTLFVPRGAESSLSEPVSVQEVVNRCSAAGGAVPTAEFSDCLRTFVEALHSRGVSPVQYGALYVEGGMTRQTHPLPASLSPVICTSSKSKQLAVRLSCPSSC